MEKATNGIIEWWEKWRARNKFASRLFAIAIWLLTTLPNLFSLRWQWVVILLAVVGLIVLIAFFMGDLAVAKQRSSQFFWFPWLLVFPFYITVTTGQILWQIYRRKVEVNRVAWDGERSQKDETIRKLKEKVELSPEQESQWNRASTAFERGKYYRDINTNWTESAKAFEEAYTSALFVALKHPEKCAWAGHLAGDLVEPYRALSRTNDANAALEVKILLEGLMNGDISFSASSPCISPAIRMRDRISKEMTR